MNVAVEEILAVLIMLNGGKISISIDEFRHANLKGKVIAVGAEDDNVVLTVEKEEDVDYGDN